MMHNATRYIIKLNLYQNYCCFDPDGWMDFERYLAVRARGLAHANRT
jgi:hypothetical protein